MKTPGNPHGNYSLASERIVSAVGDLIGAPVRPTALIEVPSGFESYFQGDGRGLRECVAHGSLLLEGDVIESNALDHLKRDDNLRRQPALIALWKWCLGEDAQWLYSAEEDYSIWSFDHGCWFDSQEAPWDSDFLAESTNSQPLEELGVVKGMDSAHFHEMASRLESVTHRQLLEAVATVPESWDVKVQDLETVAWFLYVRRRPVADVLRLAAARVAS